MIEHKTACVDMETKMQIVLSEASYNFACSWLESKGFTDYDKFDSNIRYTTMVFTKPAKRVFVYDEERGYLLGD